MPCFVASSDYYENCIEKPKNRGVNVNQGTYAKK